MSKKKHDIPTAAFDTAESAPGGFGKANEPRVSIKGDRLEADEGRRTGKASPFSGRSRYASIAVGVVVLLAALLVAGYAWFSSYFADKIHDERASQMTEIVEQVGVTFGNSLESNWQLVGAAQNICEPSTIASQADVVSLANSLDATMNLTDVDAFFVLLDSRGQSYDASGAQGIWADFEQVGTSDRSTFIADSRSYEGVYWAFVQKLDAPIATQDGSTTITYIALLRSTDIMKEFFASSAYQEVSETYVLEPNGTRMYDNSDQDDTLDAYNVFKALREAEEASGGDFDEVEQQLQENGVATSEVTYNDQDYCYSLYALTDYNTVVMFWIPSDSIATNTVDMASSIVTILMVGWALFAVLIGVGVFALARLQGRSRLYEMDRENLRKQELANKQLSEANQMLASSRRAAESALSIAESANKAKSNFLSDMSHDIRTPMNAIVGFEQLLERDADDPELVRQHAYKIRLSSQHLLNLINDILDMSRIESGKMVLNMERFAVNELLFDLEDMVAAQVDERHQTLRVESLLPDDFAVVGDRLRMNQILMNFLSNAIRYTPDGGCIWLRAERIDNGGTINSGVGEMAKLRFSVQDTGIGMSKEFLTRIFEPFEREENTTVSGVQGTGLGMAINKNLVDLMGGLIRVESELGKGSTFTAEISFRLAEQSAIGAQEVESEESDARDVAADVLQGAHFLLAEDNDINAEIMSELLKMEGATCDVAHNGKEALEIFAACDPGTYAAILMDVQMPVMDGYEATRAIRACDHPEATSVLIVAMTANAFAEDKQNALAAGMDAHIPKPVEMAKLKEFLYAYRGDGAGEPA